VRTFGAAMPGRPEGLHYMLIEKAIT
jgi:hypothetical protein